MAREPVPINPAEDSDGFSDGSDERVNRVHTEAGPRTPVAPSQIAAQAIDGETDQTAAKSRSETDAKTTLDPSATQRPLSAAKLAANRQNAQRSTGPRTQAGKNRSRWNATQHGLFAKYAVIVTDVLRESREEFDQLHAALRRDLKPQGATEELLVERIATIYWRHARVLRFESTQIDRAMRSPAAEVMHMIYGRPAEKGLTMEMPPRAVDEIILRREAMNDRQLYRAFHELERRQRARRGEDVEPPKAHV